MSAREVSTLNAADVAAPEIDALVGQTISDRYLILERVGDGAMGVVYLAEHTLMHKRVAVKVLHGEMSRVPEIVARFEREAVAAGHIQHPNVASATDFGKLPDGTFFLVLEYIEGVTLRKRLSHGRLPVAVALHIGAQITQGLQRAHSLNIVHRDLKPENIILVEREGDPNFVKILDFGIARVPMGELGSGEQGLLVTQAGMVYGTPEYMAPEQALGEDINGQSDLYALGIMLFEMITGWRPFDADSKVQLLGMHIGAPIPRLQEKAPDVLVPVAVEGLIVQLMQKNAAARPADAKEVLARLKQIEDTGNLTTSPPPNLTAPTSSQPRLHIGEPGLDSAEVTLPFRAEARPSRRALSESPKTKPSLMIAYGILLLTLVGSLFVVVLRRAVSVSGTSNALDAASSSTAGGDDPRAPKDGQDAEARARTLFEAGRLADGLTELEAVRDLDSMDLTLIKGALAKALLQSDTADRAVGFLARAPGSTACDLLFDAATTTSNGAIRKRALDVLERPEMRAKASDALAIAIELQRIEPGCGVKPLLGRAASVGDTRSLTPLKALVKPRMVKVRGHYLAVNSLACLHTVGEPGKTIAKIEERTKTAQ
jgi:eukaryotic-like serine/threonine-protein kinase